FQACPAPSLAAVGNLYRLSVLEQRLWWVNFSMKLARISTSLAGNFWVIRFCGIDGCPRLFLHHELGAREFRKTAAFGHQFIESSTFDHVAIVENQDSRGVADRGEAMCDHEGGTPLHHLC